jgi:hypothetical protein
MHKFVNAIEKINENANKLDINNTVYQISESCLSLMKSKLTQVAFFCT